MGDDRDHARSVRRRGETPAQDLPGLAGEDVDRYDHGDDASSAGWMRSGVWIGAILALLIFYFLLLPALIIYLENKGFFNTMSSPVERMLEVSLFPITWLYENVTAFEAYIDWLDSKMP